MQCWAVFDQASFDFSADLHQIRGALKDGVVLCGSVKTLTFIQIEYDLALESLTGFLKT